MHIRDYKIMKNALQYWGVECGELGSRQMWAIDVDGNKITLPAFPPRTALEVSCTPKTVGVRIEKQWFFLKRK